MRPPGTSPALLAGSAIFVLAAASAVWWFAGGSPANQTGPGLRGASNGLIYVADTTGAVVVDSDGPRGVSRRGGEVWTNPALGSTYDNVVCEVRCPAAVMSGSLNGAPRVPDPAPEPLGGKRLDPTVLRPPGVVKNVVLAVSKRSLVRMVTDERGRASLQVQTLRGDVWSIPIPSADVGWSPTSDGAEAVVSIFAKGRGLTTQRFVLRDDVWRPAGSLVKSGSRISCVAEDGTLLLDRPLRFLAPDGTSTPVRNVPAGGACSFFATGVVVAAYTASIGTEGESFSTVLTSVGRDGRLLWTQTFDNTEAQIRADVKADLFAVVVGNRATVRRPDGTVVETFPGVQDVAFDERGDVVVLWVDGTVTWENL